MEQNQLEFEKKQIIYSESIGICIVDEIAKLAASKDADPVLYYGLRSLVDKKKVSYVPVSNHQVVLRLPISKEEAMELKKQENLTSLQQQEIDYVLGEGIFHRE